MGNKFNVSNIKMNIMVLWKTTFAAYLIICTFQDLVDAGCDETADIREYSRSYDYDYYYRHPWNRPAPRKTVESITVNCQSVNLTEDGLPALLNKQYDCSSCPQTLIVTESSISTIPESAFSNYPGTTNLEMININIENIVPGAFDNLSSLVELSLANNKISYISEGIFDSLEKLEVLDLSNNSIQNISKNVFADINLRTLNLSSNSLKYIDSYLISKLRGLDASFNQLTMFNFTNISESNEYLKLCNNRIESIYGCLGTTRKIDLSNNLLTSLQNLTCVNNISNIVELDLSNNLLSKIERIPNLEHIRSLCLQGNKINYISTDFFSELNKVDFLNLSSNELSQFQYGLFDRLDHLEVLDVSHNRLPAFKKFNYHLLKYLKKLYLDDNKITTLDFSDVKDILPLLREISFRGNNFTCDILVDIIHDLKKFGNRFYDSRPTTVLPGRIYNSSNIHGIACLENEASLEDNDDNTTLYDSLKKRLYNLFNVDFSNSSMYNYFNNGFKDSNFYKFLDNFKFRSLDKNVDNMKYLQEFEDKFNKSVIGYFSNDFRNSDFVRYFEKFKTLENPLKVDVTKSTLYNYLNKGFVNSNFYKYLEGLRNPQYSNKYSADTNFTKVEKLVTGFDNPEQKNGDSVSLVVIIILLIVNSCILMSFMYMSYTYIKKIVSVRDDHVQLI